MQARSAMAKVGTPGASPHASAQPATPPPSASAPPDALANASATSDASRYASLAGAAGLPAGSADTARVTVIDRLMASRPARRFFAAPAVARVLAPARGMGSLAKFIRYSMVSVVAILISQVVILLAAWLFHLSGVASNALGAVASTPASYELNRKWAWGKRGKSHIWKEVVPFWALTFAGLAASTVTVQIADTMAKSHHVYGIDRALAIMGASLFAWGVVWVAKFVIFNQVVFAAHVAKRGPSQALKRPVG